MNYSFEYSEEAKTDLRNLANTIIYEYKSPVTAFNYLQGIIDTIKNLCNYPKVYAICSASSLLQYGHFVRRVNYKKMAIIYSIYENTVYIHRIIAGALIWDID